MFLVIVFLILLCIGLPICFVIGGSSLAWLFAKDMDIILLAQRMFTGMDSFVLLAMPFFVLCGNLMNHSGITKRMIAFAKVCVGHLPGGLSQINVLTSMLFAGVSGSASADTSAVGGVLIPAMVEEGYDADYSAAVTAASSCVGPIIPPSHLMLVYAVQASCSPAYLFVAGVVPGVILGLSQMVLCAYYAKKRGYMAHAAKPTWKAFFVTAKDGLLALMAPVIILGGIAGGICSPTEAGAFAATYCILIGMFVYKELKLKDLPKILLESAKTAGSCFLIISTASFLAWLITAQGIPQLVTSVLGPLSHNWMLLMLGFVIILLFFGTFMDTIAAMIILVPIFLPLAIQAGIHPVHLGLVVVLGMDIGVITPPVGVCLFLACKIAKIKLEPLVKAILPFLAVCIFVLLLIAFIPELTLFLPEFLGV